MGAVRIVKLPDIGEGVAEAELVAWHVKPGDLVREDQVLAEVMTDKATVEIPSPAAGTVAALGGEVGAMLAVGGELVRLEVPGGPAEASQREAVGAEAPPRQEAKPPKPRVAVTADTAPRAEARAEARAAPPRPAPIGDARPLAAPAVRRRAGALGMDLRRVRGSGPEGRILHEDLDAVLRGGGGGAGPGAAAVPRARPDAVEEVQVTGLRRVVAERMAEATRRVAHFSYVEEVDATALEELRAALNAGAAGAGRPRLTPLPFVMRAVVRALAEFPQMNAHYDDEAQVIRRRRAVHLGIATQTASGLMVPVVRHAEARDLWDCAAEAARLAEAARQGRATREELAGSTVTVTSLGALGGVASTPVVNRPEVAILGVNRMAVRPVWRDGGVVPRTMMNLSSSFDHRVVDGHEAASFVRRVKERLETPALLFVE